MVTSGHLHCAVVAGVTVEELVKFLVSTQILQNVGGVRMVGKHSIPTTVKPNQYGH